MIRSLFWERALPLFEANDAQDMNSLREPIVVEGPDLAERRGIIVAGQSFHSRKPRELRVRTKRVVRESAQDDTFHCSGLMYFKRVFIRKDIELKAT